MVSYIIIRLRQRKIANNSIGAAKHASLAASTCGQILPLSLRKGCLICEAGARVEKSKNFLHIMPRDLDLLRGKIVNGFGLRGRLGGTIRQKMPPVLLHGRVTPQVEMSDSADNFS